LGRTGVVRHDKKRWGLCEQEIAERDLGGLPRLGERAAPVGLVGELEDSLTVTPQGEAAYTMPLAVPVGRAGMEPNLALSYQSGNGDGLFGVGFDLTGVPARIRRCPESDRDNAQINWAAGNFCLGSNRLIRVANVSTNAEYRTRAESYARIETLGATAAPTSFTITERSGNAVFYGQRVVTTRWRNDSVNAQADASTSEGSVIVEWSGFLAAKFREEWNEVETIYDRIRRHELAARLEALVGEVFTAHMTTTHAA